MLRQRTHVGMLPNFLIVGAQRSGSSALASYLRAHPDVFMTQKKELHFFDVQFDRGVEWYREHFREAEPQHAIGEATPAYLYDERVPARIASVLPSVRLIAILRNPVDRAYSHYWFNRARGHEDLRFDAAIEAEPGRLATGDRATRIGKSYLDRGRYVHQLRRLGEHYPKESIHVVLLDDLRHSPEETYRSVCRFIDVNDSFAPANLGSPVARFLDFRSHLLFKVTRRLPRGIGGAIRRVNAREATYPPMDPGMRTRLVEMFRDDNEALEAWLQRDLLAWRI